MQPIQSAFIDRIRTTLIDLSGGHRSEAGTVPPERTPPRPRLHLAPAALLLIAGIAFIALKVPGLALPLFLGSVYLAGAAMWQLFRSVRQAVPAAGPPIRGPARCTPRLSSFRSYRIAPARD